MDTHILLIKRPFSNLTIASLKLVPKIIVLVSLSLVPFPEQNPKPTIAWNINCSSILVGYCQQKTKLLIPLSFNIILSGALFETFQRYCDDTLSALYVC